VAAELADLNEDGQLDLILVGYEKAGVQVYFGDGTGNWRLHTTLPEPGRAACRPGPRRRDLQSRRSPGLGRGVSTLGVYIYYGECRGGSRRPVIFTPRPPREFRSSPSVTSQGWPPPISSSTEPLPVRASPTVPTSISGRPRRWTPSSAGLRILKYAAAGVALGDLDGDGNLDIVAGGT